MREPTFTNAICKAESKQISKDFAYCEDALGRAENAIGNLPSAQPEIIHCGDCKYFELDHFEKVDEFPIPIIVAHEVCMKWGEGCKSSVDGWCFMAERRTDETD